MQIYANFQFPHHWEFVKIIQFVWILFWKCSCADLIEYWTRKVQTLLKQNKLKNAWDSLSFYRHSNLIFPWKRFNYCKIVNEITAISQQTAEKPW